MIGLIFALFGLACIVYVTLILALSCVGILLIAWKLIWATGRQLLSLFTRSSDTRIHRKRLRKGQARSRHPLPTSSRTTTAWKRGGVHRRFPEANVGNDITIIAGDQTPGRALYSEIDPPPRSKLAEN